MTPKSFVECFEANARRAPDATALAFAGAEMSYGVLDARSNQLARFLVELGVGPDSRVGVAMPRSFDMAMAVLAALKAGGAYVPIDPAYPAARVSFMVGDAKARPILTLRDVALAGEGGARRSGEGDGELVLDDPTTRAHVEKLPTTSLGRRAGADALGYVLYTSGSTGQPKGVAMTRGPLDHLCAWQVSMMTADPTIRTLQFAPLSFDVHWQEMFAAWATGGALVLISEEDRLDSERLLGVIERERIGRLFLPMVALTALAEAATQAKRFPRSLREVITAGEQVLVTPMVRAFFEALEGCPLHNHYGLTETHVVTCHVLEGPARDWPTIPPIGATLPYVRAHLRDEEGREVEDGGEGELFVAGAGVGRGYLDRPELTAERFVVDPLDPSARIYKTGDRVRRDEHGVFHYVGRIDTQCKVAGHRVELGEVESALASAPCVVAAAAAVTGDSAASKRLVGYVVLRDGPAGNVSAATKGALRAHLAERGLPPYMIPSVFVTVDALPRTPSGKVERKALPPPPRQRPELNAVYVAPESARERLIAEVWSEILELDAIGVDDGFFDLGGTSLLAARASVRLRERGLDVSTVRLFAAPTIAGLVASLDSGAPVSCEAAPSERNERDERDEVAIVGMACRFPGAPDVETFWKNLVEGVDSIARFDADLDASVPASLARDPRYVRARGIVDGADRFDAAFFGVMPSEAAVMDPQQRLLLEVAWEAVEHAGHTPESLGRVVGVFAGVHNNTYASHVLADHAAALGRVSPLSAMMASEKDYVATRIAHKLGLTGPAISVQTACSTSLVAVSQGFSAIRAGECDVAICGAAALTFPQKVGHLPEEGGVQSADGRCRPFDAAASGTLFSDGVGVVVLKRLADARRDGDTVYAIVKGAAINNDGADRASFSAPSVGGQAKVIARAHAVAGVEPRSIQYVEAHGTATPLGDPIEVEALTKAFGGRGEELRGTCGIGSVKSNLGHLSPASGVAGLIKVVLGLQNERIPASLHCEEESPRLELAHSPFYVVREAKPWPRGGRPRRAGISSFGFGGTNAHVVVEEGDAPAAPAERGRPKQVLVLSARTEAALERATHRLATTLASASPERLADAAFVLATGRRVFPFRRAVVAATGAEAAAALGAAPRREHDGRAPALAFMFPGQGAQYVGMGKTLYASDPTFRGVVDECAEAARSVVGADIRQVMFGGDEATLAQTAFTQVALFTIEIALARMLASWGIVPRALVGHSVGEFAAACFAGVLTLPDALRLVARRGQLMQALPAGKMAIVALPASELASRLPGEVNVASKNGPRLTVVSGPSAPVDALVAKLEAEGVRCRPLVTSHAFHSAMMDPAALALRDEVRSARLAPPRIPIVSTVTGTWLTDAEATSPDYWATQLRKTVLFEDAAAELWTGAWPGRGMDADARLLVEVGPRTTLATLARQHEKAQAAVATLSDRADGDAEWTAIASALGQLFVHGAAIDWARFHAGEQRCRVALPTYPFEPRRCWIDEAAAPEVVATVAAAGRVDRIATELLAKLSEMSGLPIASADPDTTFMELGLDSLLLTQVALEVGRIWGRAAVKVSFRQLQGELRSPRLLARHVDAALPAEPAPAAAAVLPPPEKARQVAYDPSQAFGAIARIRTALESMTDRQRAMVAELTSSYCAKTRRSKDYAQKHRATLADPRVVTGFRPAIKELVYPIVIESSDGARLRDIDGNEYVDALNGFGSSMFGGRAPFIVRALEEQLARGYEIGPQHPLTGEVADLVCELTGAERAALCNTGSEAVMGCIRIARCVTGRSTIVVFSGSYHGIFDEVVVRGTKDGKSIPAAPGILPEAVQNVLVLEYGTEESLEAIRARAHEIAAIVVEPVQSRRPDFAPREFLHDLRRVADESGAALVFDEVITGFRLALGGAQEYFGVRADLASYGKVIGGGQPIGVITGKRAWMDALDGGHWQYGDDSAPTVGVTYFAGTFVRHPLALAAAKASLLRLKEAGPALQEDLTRSTEAMAGRLNAFFAQEGVPIVIKHFASLWRTAFTEEVPFGELLFCLLRRHGVHVWDGFPCFLTTAHGETEIAFIVDAFEKSVRELVAAGFLRGAARVVEAPPKEVPTTEAQREIWTAMQLVANASRAYNESISIRLSGALDRGALRSALDDLAARHESLRGTISADGLTLRIAPAEGAAIPLAIEEGVSSARFAAVSREEVTVPFDVTRGPLVRARLLALAGDDHVLVLTAHHVVLDGWSIGVVLRDLGALYEARRDNRAKTAHALPRAPQFSDYSRVVRDEAAEQARKKAIAFWTERLAGSPNALELPTDFLRPKERTLRSSRVTHSLDGELVAELRRVGAKHGASLFVTLLSAITSFLGRLADQEELVIGIPAAGQSSTGMADLVGHCVNTLPLRLALDREDTFVAVLERTRAGVLDAYEHQSVTIGEVLRHVRVPRDPGRPPLTASMFNLDPAIAAGAASFTSLRAEVTSNPRAFEHCELFVNATDRGGRIDLETQFAEELFDERTIRSWLAALETMLRGAVRDPSLRMTAHPLASAAWQSQLATRNDATAREVPRDRRVHELFAASAEARPDATAIVTADGQRRVTYGALEALATRFAAELVERGARPGARVGVYLERSVEMVAAVWGVLASGAAYVPLDPTYPAARLALVCADSGMSILLTERSLADEARALADEAKAKTGRAIEVVVREELDESLAGGEPHAVAERPGAEDAAYVIYTSGSTGIPKGVIVPHRAVVSLLASMQASPGITKGDVLLAVTTLSFDIAVMELHLPLAAGAQIVLATREDAADGRRLLDAIGTHGVTMLQGTPATFRLLLDAGWQGPAPRKVLVGGEAVPLDLANELARRAAEAWNMYGPTETTVWSTCWKIPAETRRVLVGSPIANTRTYVLDAHGAPVPTSVPGELYIGGEGVATGYHDRPELTGERFVPDPFAPPASPGRMYRTGDLVRLTHDGEIEYLRRNDGQVKVRGYRIELGDIEGALAAHEGVRSAVVVVREDRPGDARIVAYSIPVPGEEPTEADLRKHLRRRLPDYMLPHHFVELEAFPLTPNGKIDRRALPAPRRSGDDARVLPRTSSEKLIAAIWQEALGLESVDARARFFEIGGHSLIAIRVVVEIEKQTGVKLSPLVLLVDSLEQIAAQLDGEKARLESPVSAEWPTMGTVTRVDDGASLLDAAASPSPEKRAEKRPTPTPPPSSRRAPRSGPVERPSKGMLSRLGKLLRGSR